MFLTLYLYSIQIKYREYCFNRHFVELITSNISNGYEKILDSVEKYMETTLIFNFTNQEMKSLSLPI